MTTINHLKTAFFITIDKILFPELTIKNYFNSNFFFKRFWILCLEKILPMYCELSQFCSDHLKNGEELCIRVRFSFFLF